MQDSDNDICLLLRNRDVKGMELLFKEYYRPLVLWADTFLNNMSQAEDLIQDFFVKCVRKDRSSEGGDDVAKIDVPSLEYNDLNEKMLCKIEQEIENLPPQS